MLHTYDAFTHACYAEMLHTIDAFTKYITRRCCTCIIHASTSPTKIHHILRLTSANIGHWSLACARYTHKHWQKRRSAKARVLSTAEMQITSRSHPNPATSSTQHTRGSSEEPNNLSLTKHPPQEPSFRANLSICVRSHHISFPRLQGSQALLTLPDGSKPSHKSSAQPKSIIQHHARSNGATLIGITLPILPAHPKKECLHRAQHPPQSVWNILLAEIFQRDHDLTGKRTI